MFAGDGTLIEDWGDQGDWHDISNRYLYGGWDALVAAKDYGFSHEPLQTTLIDVNLEPECTHYFDKRHADRWKGVESVRPTESLAAVYVDKFFSNPRDSKASNASRKKAREEQRVPDRADECTDTAFKGVFGRMSTCVNQGGCVSDEMFASFLLKAEAFIGCVEEDSAFLTGNTAFAPFSKLVLNETWLEQNAPPGWVAQLNAIAKKKTKGKYDTAEAWVTARKPVKKPPKPKPVEDKEKANGRGGTDEEVSEPEDLHDDDKSNGILATDLVQKASFKKMAEKVAKLETKVGQLTESLESLFKEQNDQVSRYNTHLHEHHSATVTPAGESKDMADLKQHNLEMIALMAQLGTVVNILAPAGCGTSGTSGTSDTSDVEKVRELAAGALFDGIINTVSNVYHWDAGKQKAFYSALLGIEKFKTALQQAKATESN